jgi:hypothetical protein
MVLDMSTDQLHDIAEDLARRHPDDPDTQAAALDTARRVLAGDTAVVDELATKLAAIRREETRVKAALAQAARLVIEPGTRGANSEVAYGRRVGVNRLTVRAWLGK